MVGDVAQHERRAVEPGDPAQRRHVGDDREVAVAALPVGHLVARDGIHLHVEREQVVAALDAVLDDVVEEVLRLDALAEQPALHVGEGGDDRVDRAVLDLLAQVVERQHAGGPAGAAGAGGAALLFGAHATVARLGSSSTITRPSSSVSIVRTGPVYLFFARQRPTRSRR